MIWKLDWRALFQSFGRRGPAWGIHLAALAVREKPIDDVLSHLYIRIL